MYLSARLEPADIADLKFSNAADEYEIRHSLLSYVRLEPRSEYQVALVPSLEQFPNNIFQGSKQRVQKTSWTEFKQHIQRGQALPDTKISLNLEFH
jgi:hypothetical protein